MIFKIIKVMLCLFIWPCKEFKKKYQSTCMMRKLTIQLLPDIMQFSGPASQIWNRGGSFPDEQRTAVALLLITMLLPDLINGCNYLFTCKFNKLEVELNLHFSSLDLLTRVNFFLSVYFCFHSLTAISLSVRSRWTSSSHLDFGLKS